MLRILVTGDTGTRKRVTETLERLCSRRTANELQIHLIAGAGGPAVYASEWAARKFLSVITWPEKRVLEEATHMIVFGQSALTAPAKAKGLLVRQA